MIKFALPLALLSILAVSGAAHAEAKLDDESIRKLYQEQTDAAKDADKTLQIMQNQLADEFILQVKIVYDFGNGSTAHETKRTFNKAQVMESARSAGQSEKIEKFENKINSIKYTADHRYAYVDDSTTMIKTVEMPTSGSQGMQVHATTGQACIDTLAVVGSAIQLVRSQCYQKVMVAR